MIPSAKRVDFGLVIGVARKPTDRPLAGLRASPRGGKALSTGRLQDFEGSLSAGT